MSLGFVQQSVICEVLVSVIRLQHNTILMARQADTLRSYSHRPEVPAGMNALIHSGKHTNTPNALPPTGTDKQAPVTSDITGCYM